ncbi:histone deacetylase complex subunit SAP30L isoform X2 [Fukomys damarensis]|uniref:histone deacetylase complex subunit SAP30L isoform X2 n=1 Tax=Fukomys damarensis TaxID=885580 RepID=UPI00053F9275|nr:histone deacetylase complex subunit SAP30L isoform X2 [Fukomys damarensis]
MTFAAVRRPLVAAVTLLEGRTWALLMVSHTCSRTATAQAQRWFSPEVRHLYICDFHKNFIQSVRNKRKRKTSDDGGDSPEHDTDIPEVDLFQLQVNTLRRYKRHYKLQTRPGFNKAQLAEVSHCCEFFLRLSFTGVQAKHRNTQAFPT